jgi:tight adherence protein C
MLLVMQLAIGVGLLLVVAGLVYVGLREDRNGNPLDDRLAALGEREIDVDSLQELELQLSFKDRVLIPVVERLADITAKFTPQKQLEQSRKLIELAGMNTDPTQFFLLRIVLTIVGGLVGMGLGFVALSGNPFQALLATGVGIMIGNYFPVLSMTSRIQKRQAEVVKHLPDALDLLVICVEAGLGFDQAMGKVYEKWDNEMSLAFGRVLREIQLGKNRKDALKDMADRLDVADVNSFTAAIIQAEQLGVSMAKILRVQSDQMRIKRRQRAQEKAMQAPVKMMIPMVLIIFPSIWIILMGPAAIRISKQFFGIGD